MPDERGPRTSSRWHAAGLAVAIVVVVAGVLVAAIRLPGGADRSAASPSTSVLTAPMSTAATPSPTSVTSGALAPEPAPRRSPCQDPRSPVLRVLQFNIRYGMSTSGVVDLPEIASEIRVVHPDLVSLNEVDTNTQRTHVDEPAYLAGATGLHVVYGPNLIWEGGPFGNAILTRYPVIESHNLRLPGTAGLEPRGLLTVIVGVDGRRVAFSSTHLSDGDEGRQSRALQAMAVAKALHSMPIPTIVAGDLNSVPTDLPERILRQHLLDAQQEGGTGPGDTLPEEAPVSRIDYVLYDHHFAVVPGSTQVRPSESSDHRSVFTELALLPKTGC